MEKPDAFLRILLTVNTLSRFGAASLVVIGEKDWIHDYPWLFVLAFAVGTVLFYALCELLPKMLFRLYPNRLSLLLSGPFAVVHFALRPLVTLLRWLAAGLLRWTGGRTFVGGLFGTREEMMRLRPNARPVNAFQFGLQIIRTKVNVMAPRDWPNEVVDVTAAMYEPTIGHDMLDDIFANSGD